MCITNLYECMLLSFHLIIDSQIFVKKLSFFGIFILLIKTDQVSNYFESYYQAHHQINIDGDGDMAYGIIYTPGGVSEFTF